MSWGSSPARFNSLPSHDFCWGFRETCDHPNDGFNHYHLTLTFPKTLWISCVKAKFQVCPAQNHPTSSSSKKKTEAPANSSARYTSSGMNKNSSKRQTPPIQWFSVCAKTKTSWVFKQRHLQSSLVYVSLIGLVCHWAFWLDQGGHGLVKGWRWITRDKWATKNTLVGWVI